MINRNSTTEVIKVSVDELCVRILRIVMWLVGRDLEIFFIFIPMNPHDSGSCLHY